MRYSMRLVPSIRTKHDYRTILFSYRFDSAEWSLEISATCLEEARERVKALSFTRYNGELIARLPKIGGPFARFAVWFKNAIRVA